jgi:hypothetical protein
MFRDRRTGAVVIVQLPNVPLLLFVVAATIRRLEHPHGTAGTAVNVVAGVALLWWAADEVLRGVNPFRRLLGLVVGLVVLAGVIAGQ